MAILRHALPDGSVHHDLLLASVPAVPDESRSVATWRCEQDPLGLAPGMATGIERIAPHRGLYLRLHERRDLGTDRGVVTPEHAGWHRCGGGLLWIARHGEAPLAFHLDDRSLRRAELPAQVKAS
jgi:hypothetical protein